jgi:hypothetical protein
MWHLRDVYRTSFIVVEMPIIYRYEVIATSARVRLAGKPAVADVFDLTSTRTPYPVNDKRPAFTEIIQIAEPPMPDQHRDDSPAAFSLARREVVIGGAFLVGGLAAGLMPTQSAMAAWSEEASARFMEVSSLLIQHRLDQEVGKRLGAAMGALNSQLSDQVAELLAIAKNKNAKIVEDFFPDVPEGPLKETAHSIISAWYLGVVTDAPDAEVFAFETALMYQPTRDVMTIPSYAISGPNGWSADAPPLENMPDF